MYTHSRVREAPYVAERTTSHGAAGAGIGAMVHVWLAAKSLALAAVEKVPLKGRERS